MKLSLIREGVATDDDYWSAMASGKPEALDAVRDSERHLPDMGAQHVVNWKTESGNLIVRWVELGPYVLLLGLIARSGKMNRRDKSEVLEWIDKFAGMLASGRQIMTSTNASSGPLLNRVIAKAEERGVRVSMQEMEKTTVAGDEYVNVLVSAV